jgi:hypothetical protein
MRLFASAEQQSLTAAPSRAPQVNLTVIHVEAGAHLSVVGAFVEPHSAPAIPQQVAIEPSSA